MRTTGTSLNYQQFQCGPGSSSTHICTSGQRAPSQTLYRPMSPCFHTELRSRSHAFQNLFWQRSRRRTQSFLYWYASSWMPLSRNHILFLFTQFAETHTYDQNFVNRNHFKEAKMSVNHLLPDLATKNPRVLPLITAQAFYASNKSGRRALCQIPIPQEHTIVMSGPSSETTVNKFKTNPTHRLVPRNFAMTSICF